MTVVGLLLGRTKTAPDSLGPSNLYRDAFKPAPKGLLVNGEMMFTRLHDSQLSRVHVTPSDAARIAETQYSFGHGSRVVFESLGGFVDKSQIIPDWVGTRSWIPKAVPSYIVRIYNVHVETVDPSTNHFWNVIVNAASGKIVVAFTYD